MNLAGSRAPVLLVAEVNALSFEFVLIIQQAVAEQPYGLVTATELLKEFRSSHKGIRQDFLPDSAVRRSSPVARIAFVNGDEELASLGVEDGGDSIFARRRSLVIRVLNGVLCGEIDYIGGDYIERIDCNDFCGIGQVHCLCESHSDAQAGEAAGADRYVDLLNFLWFSAEAVQQATNGRKNLCTMSDGCGKGGFGEYLFAKCYCNGAYSAGGFDS